MLLSLGDSGKSTGYEETHHGEDHCRRRESDTLLIEALHPVANSAEKHCGADREQKADENRADDGGLQQLRLPRAQQREHDNKFGQRSKRRIKQTADSWTRASRKYLGCLTYEIGHRNQCEERDDEDNLWAELKRGGNDGEGHKQK